MINQVDLKLDDGEYWNGRMRSSCYGKDSSGNPTTANTIGYTDYDYAIDNNKKCGYMYYAL